MRVIVNSILPKLSIFCVTALLCLSSFAQSDSSKINFTETVNNIPNSVLSSVESKYDKLTGTIQGKSRKILSKMHKQEEKIYKKLYKTDSLKAHDLIAQSQAKYQELQNKIRTPVNIADKLTEYIPGLDSINTAMKFLQINGSQLSDMPTDKLRQIQSTSGQIEELQSRLQQANEIKAFIREREAELKTVLENSGFGKELLKINKKAYYYEQQLRTYKEMLHNPDRIAQKALEVLNRSSAFHSFMQRNSYLAQLFRMPDNYGTTTALTGLQTRAQIQQQITQRFSGTGVNPQQYVQQQMQTAKEELNKVKDKINQLGGGSSDMTMPDFKPNQEKTKSLFQRLQYGFNIQSQQGTSFLPAMSDLALSLGYKLGDNKVMGLSASYKLGLGSGWNDIRFTNEGIGLRSYADIKAKGSIWITGGFEYNYLQRFSNFNEIKNIEVWQRSALAGLTKKYKIGKKREGNIQLLYDFLAQRQIPQGQALKFRIGWTF